MAKAPREGTSWTNDELTELAKLVHHATPTAVIAERLGRSEASVERKVTSEGMDKRSAPL
jgi:hypothetical protein